MPGALTRDSWIDAAFDALAERGVDAVRVESLALRLGVTKGSFYWHFENRPALLEALLARWEEAATVAIVREVEAEAGSPEARLRALFRIALASTRMSLETAIRAWGRHDAATDRAVCRVDRRRMDYLRALFTGLGLAPEEAQARAFLAYASLFGDHFIAGASLRGGDLFARCTALLLAPPTRRVGRANPRAPAATRRRG